MNPKLEERLVKALMLLSTTAIIGALVAVVAIIIWNGRSALSLEMLTQVPSGGYYLGGKGGVLNAIVGSLMLGIGAVILAFPLALLTALYMQKEYAKPRTAQLLRLALDVLWGVPSIIYGAFGFVVMMMLGMRASLLAGIITLALVILPIMARGIDETLERVQAELKETAYSLGSTRYETVKKVVLRQALPGIITATLLAFGRGIGDAASILFTAGYTDNIPSSLFDPVASLPLAVFFQLGTPFQVVQERAYASAAILLVIVLAINFATRKLAKKSLSFVIK